MTTDPQSLALDLQDYFPWSGNDTATLARLMEYGEQDEAATRAAIAYMVSQGDIRPKKGHPDTWELNLPDPPPFIQKIADQVGNIPKGLDTNVRVHSSYNGDCIDYDIYLEPMTRRRYYISEEAADQATQEARERGYHVLKFRKIVEYGSHWVVFLEHMHQCYVQSQGDEDDPFLTPEAAYQDLLKSLGEEVNLLQGVANSLPTE